MTCTCWVRKLPDARRFSMRYGTHALSCSAYRESGDPVDHKYDREVREAAKARGDIGQDD